MTLSRKEAAYAFQFATIRDMDYFLRFLPSLLTIILALIGYFAWHRQLVVRRRFEVAEKCVEVATKAMDVISNVRQLHATREELDAVKDNTDGRVAPDLLHLMKTLAAISTRLESEKAVFAELRTAQIIAKTHLPKAVHDALQVLLDARRDIRISLQAYSFAHQDFRGAEDQSAKEKYAKQVKQAERVLQELRTGIEQAPDESDKLSLRLDTAMKVITTECEPLFRDRAFLEFVFPYSKGRGGAQ